MDAKDTISDAAEQTKSQVEAAMRAAEGMLGPNPIVGLNKKDVLEAASTVLDQAVKQPALLGTHYMSFLKETAKALTGTSEVKPQKGDKRFTDDAWTKNPIYKAYMQTYLAGVESLQSWLDDMGLDHKNTERTRFLMSLVTDTFVATNTLLGNPAALKKLIETKGGSGVRGMQHMIDDMLHNNFMPSQVNKSNFEVGKNLANTPGSVVYRDEILELIQYTPSTPKVQQVPILVVPPQINKFYVFDLSEEKSMAKYLVDQGFQVFIISWRNPTPAQRDWGIIEYVHGIEGAAEAMSEITKCKKINIIGACSGGITVALGVEHLTKHCDIEVNTLTLMVSVLDVRGAEDTTIGHFSSKETIELAKLASQGKGILEGAEMGRIFAWLRPNDLIWNYWVNNYLMGNEPPSFDILYWNNDSTRLPAKLHTEFLDLFNTNPLVKHGEMILEDTPVDLAHVEVDSFIVGGVTDHITPWKGTYKTTQMLGGKSEYVLSYSGHIQAILSPPGNPKSSYFINDATPENPEEYLETATRVQGSWWDHWNKWLTERSGKEKAAPKTLGSKMHPAGENSPGTYVKEV
ncbi:MAG: alpha/beta fold hydrolase [Rhodospirillales bacterium]|nr:alpha/beta fold hydrolase [Rhodospirillales bacterium]